MADIITVQTSNGQKVLNDSRRVERLNSDLLDGFHADTIPVSSSRQLDIDAELDCKKYKLINLANPTEDQDAATKTYVDALLQDLDWQNSVLDKDLLVAPASPTLGDRYIINGVGAGLWESHDYNITEYVDDHWEFIVPNKGYVALVEDELLQYVWTGSAWVVLAAIVGHNSLSGLQGGVANEYYHLTAAEYDVLGDDWTRDAVNGYVYTTTASDNVGIGTSAPAAKLDVDGDVKLTNLIIPVTGTTIKTTAAPGNDLFLYHDVSGNIFIDSRALAPGLLTGIANIAIGMDSLNAATGASNNVAIGLDSQILNQTGNYNVSVGAVALGSLVSGQYNVAIGANALGQATGNNNIGIGTDAGWPITSGTGNTYIGYSSGSNVSNRLFIGTNSKTSPLLDGNLSTDVLTLNAGLIVNEEGAALNTRVEGVTDANLLFVDASTDRVGIGTSVPAAKLDVDRGNRFADTVYIHGTKAGPATGDTMVNLVANGTLISPADYWFSLKSLASGSGNGVGLYGEGTGVGVYGKSVSYAGLFDGNVVVNGGLVVNETAIDVDTRIEGAADPNLIYVDAGNNRVGIGIAAPTQKLDVVGNVKLSGTIGVTGGEPGAYAITNYTGVVGGSDNWMQLWDSTGGMYINIYSGGGGPTFYTPNLLELRGGSGLNIGADGASITLNAGWSTLPYYTDGNIDISSADTKFRFGPNLWAGGVADTELTRMGAGILQTNASFHALDDVQIGNDVLLDSGSHIKWATAEANLLLYYKLDEPASTATAVDSSGNSYDGTNTNCTTGWDGRINGGYFYNKYAPSYTTCSEKTAFIFGTGDFTLSCWIRSGGLADQQAAIGKYNGTAAYWWLGIDGNTPVFGLNGVSCYGATGVVDTKWHLLTGVRSGNNITVYLDGAAGTPADVTGLSDTLDDYPVVGALGTPIVACWFGRLDEIKIYSRALSEAEILALKECRIAAFDTSLYRSAANLVAIDGGLVVNETGADSDTRIEGDTDPNLLFVDASTDLVGIGTNAPDTKLHVSGGVQCDELRINIVPTVSSITPDSYFVISLNGTDYRIPCVAD